MTIPPVYEGKEPYIFISYSQNDKELVYPIISRFQEQGYRVWYDAGNEIGRRYAQNIAVHLDACGLFIAMFTDNYYASEFCINEMNLAADKKKHRFIILLDALNLPDEIKLQHGHLLNAVRKSFTDDESFFQKVFSAPDLKLCREHSSAGDDTDDGKSAFATVRITLPNGNVYEGDCVNGKRHGKGRLTYANGDVYEGDFTDGKRHGKGRLTYANGDVYEGDFTDGKRHGKGRLTYANGDVYEGDFTDGKRHGKGRMLYSDSTVYEGDFKDGKRIGKGKFTYANGDVYEGDVTKGKRNGKGRMTYADGTVREGQWENNSFIG